MKIIAIGRSEFLYDAIVEISKKHEICAIITSHANNEYSRKEADFEKLSEELGAKFFLTNKINEEILDYLSEHKPDVGISINWLSLIGHNFISKFRHVVLNAHFGDLPKYRGNAVLNWAILRGESEAVLSIHSMVPDLLDLGDIYYQEKFKIDNNTYIGDLLKSAREKFPASYAHALINIEQNRIIKPLAALQHDKGFRCHSRLPKDGLIDWNQSAADICRLVHAVSAPFPGAFTYISENERIVEVIIWRARCDLSVCNDVGMPGQIISRNMLSGEVSVLTGDGVVILEEIQLEGFERSTRPTDFIKSTRTRLGITAYDLFKHKSI